MRWVTRIAVASSVLAMMSSAAEAAAAEANTWSLIARGGMLNTSQNGGSIGPMAGLELQWHTTANARVGAYVTAHHLWNEKDGAHYQGSRFNGARAGARGEWHFRPAAVIDPWVGAAAGVFGNQERQRWSMAGLENVGGIGFDLSVDGGLDFHVTERFIVGALVSATLPVSNWDSSAGVSTSAIGRTFAPQLRLGVSF